MTPPPETKFSKVQIKSSTSRAYTLIEILMVIALISLLAGLVIGAARSMKRSARTSETKMILSICKSVATEYETSFKGLKIPHYGQGQLYVEVNVDWSTAKTKNAPGATGTAVIDDPIERFVWLVRQHPTAAKMLRVLSKNSYLDADGNGFLEIRDSFDQKISYAVSVVHDDDGDGNKLDAEGAGDDDDFLPEYPRPFFASRGEDELWGNAKILPTVTDANSDGDDDGDDNLYSYETD